MNSKGLLFIHEDVEAGDFQVDSSKETLDSMIGSKLEKIELSHENCVSLKLSCGRVIDITTLSGTTYIDTNLS